MDFTFTEDQLLFQESVREFLVNEITADSIFISIAMLVTKSVCAIPSYVYLLYTDQNNQGPSVAIEQ